MQYTCSSCPVRNLKNVVFAIACPLNKDIDFHIEKNDLY